MKVPDILNPFMIGYSERGVEYPSLAAYIYSKSLENCGNPSDFLHAPTKTLAEVYNRNFDQCVNTELENYIKEGYAYATALSTSPELHQRLKNATDIRVTGNIRGLDAAPMVERILKQLRNSYADRVDSDESSEYAEIAKAMNYYSAAKDWFLSNGRLDDFLDASDDLFPVPSKYDIGTISQIIDQQKRAEEEKHGELAPWSRAIKDKQATIAANNEKIANIEREIREDIGNKDYRDSNRNRIQELLDENEALTAEVGALSADRPEVSESTTRSLEIRRSLLPEPVKEIAKIGLNEETRRLLREIVVEESWKEYNKNLENLRKQEIFKEYSRGQWQEYPRESGQNFEETFSREVRLMPASLRETAEKTALQLYEASELPTNLMQKISRSIQPLKPVDSNRGSRRSDIIAEIRRLLQESTRVEQRILVVEIDNGDFSLLKFPVVIEGVEPPINTYQGPYQYALVHMASQFMEGTGKDGQKTARLQKAYRILIDGAEVRDDGGVEFQGAVKPAKMLSIYKSIRTRAMMKNLEKPVARVYLRMIRDNFRQEFGTIVSTTAAGKKIGTKEEKATSAQQARTILAAIPGGRGLGKTQARRARVIRRKPVSGPPPATDLSIWETMYREQVAAQEQPSYHTETTGFRPDSPVFRPDSPVFRPDSPSYSAESPVFRPVSPVFRPDSPVFRPVSPPESDSDSDVRPPPIEFYEKTEGFSAGGSSEQEQLALISRREMLILQRAEESDFREEFLEFLKNCNSDSPESYSLARSDKYPSNTDDIPLLFGVNLLIPAVLASICRWYNKELDKIPQAGGGKKVKRRRGTDINPGIIHGISENLLVRTPKIVKSMKERVKKAEQFVIRRIREVQRTLKDIQEHFKQAPLNEDETIAILDRLYGRCIVTSDARMAEFPPQFLRKSIVGKPVFYPNRERSEIIMDFLNQYATNLYLGILNTDRLDIFNVSAINPNEVTQKTAETNMLFLLNGAVQPAQLYIDYLEDLSDEEKGKEVWQNLRRIVNGSFNPKKPQERSQLLRRWSFIIDSFQAFRQNNGIESDDE